LDAAFYKVLDKLKCKKDRKLPKQIKEVNLVCVVNGLKWCKHFSSVQGNITDFVVIVINTL